MHLSGLKFLAEQKYKYKRVFVIVIDSMGIGAMPDSEKYGDKGVDTLGHIAEKQTQFVIPNLQKVGLANLKKMKGVKPVDKPLGYQMVMSERSTGKDTMTGHWEMMGLHITKPFQTFTDTGFPKELIEELEKRSGRKIIGNKSASGTAILDELALQEMNENKLIVYTSADSVLQICGHEEKMGLKELYRICEIARELTLREEWKVGRVIARPYIGTGPGNFTRTPNRHDYALKPSGRTVLNVLKDEGFSVISVGKINDIFVGEGITEAHKSKSSVHGMEQTIEIMDKDFTGLCFVNLVDFDALWGHRRNVDGYAREIEKFDVNLGVFLDKMKDDDLLIITADHGNDPTYIGTDHTREKVPFIAYSPSMKGNGPIEESDTFATIGATISENFKIQMPKDTIGSSILNRLK
ncbi:MAG: phosphopentomutase [archaeon]|nr:phosphopentomutase [archaeon]